MSEQPEKEAKTEEPSERRLQEAFEKGNVPFSNEPAILSSLLAILAIGLMIAPIATSHLSQRLAGLLGKSADFSFSDGSDAFWIIIDEFWGTFVIAAPVLVLISIGGIVGPLMQNVPQANLERVKAKLDRLSPRSNLKRLLGKQAFINFGKITLKVLAVTTVTYWSLSREFGRVVEASSAEIWSIPRIMLSVVNAILAPLCLTALIIAIADFLIARFNWKNDLRMTRQELKDEFKQAEGDPAVKGKILKAARQRIRSRMMSDLPRATLVIANPTHFAVALRYVPEEGGAPLVLAKGVDYLALRIRGTCETLGVPVVENRSLARALHSATEVGEMIPVEFYRAVAEVIHFVSIRDQASGPQLTQG